MPVRPPVVTRSCPACGWSKTVAPRSDALMPGEVFTCCPACGHADLDSRPASIVEAALLEMSGRLKALMGKTE